MAIEDKAMLTTREVASLLGVKSTTLSQWRADRVNQDLPYCKFEGAKRKGAVRYRREDVERFIMRRMVGALPRRGGMKVTEERTEAEDSPLGSHYWTGKFLAALPCIFSSAHFRSETENAAGEVVFQWKDTATTADDSRLTSLEIVVGHNGILRYRGEYASETWFGGLNGEVAMSIPLPPVILSALHYIEGCFPDATANPR